MWGLETIKEMNREAGTRAREAHLAPFLMKEHTDTEPPFPFPNIGDMEVEVDKLYERVDTLFCDKSGYGTQGEPALSFEQLQCKLRSLLDENPEGVRIAIVEEGPFQLYLGIWK